MGFVNTNVDGSIERFDLRARRWIAAPPVHQYGIDLQQPWQLVSIHLENKK